MASLPLPFLFLLPVLLVPFTPAASGCTYGFSQNSFSVAARNVASFNVSVNTTCVWTLSTTAPWITLSVNGPFTGSGSFAVTVADNPSAIARRGSIQINDQAIQIQQSGIRCTYGITPFAADVPAAGGTATFTVVADPACSWTVSSQASWVSLPSSSTTTPAMGQAAGPGTFTANISANPTPQPRTAILTIGAQQVSISQSGTGIVFSNLSIQNAASFTGGALSPGEIFVIYGTGLGPQTIQPSQTTADGQSLTKSLGNTRVLFDGIPAPMLYASSTQVNGIVPYAVQPGAAHVTLEFLGIPSDPVTVEVAPASPGIFTLSQTGFGQAAVRNQDLTINGSGNAEAAGRVLIVYWTGGGVLSPAPADGKLVSARAPYPVVTSSMTATLGNVPATILYSGAVPTLAPGILQTNIRIPDSTPKGDAVPLLFQIGNIYATQPGVTVAIR